MKCGNCDKVLPLIYKERKVAAAGRDIIVCQECFNKITFGEFTCDVCEKVLKDKIPVNTFLNKRVCPACMESLIDYSECRCENCETVFEEKLPINFALKKRVCPDCLECSGVASPIKLASPRNIKKKSFTREKRTSPALSSIMLKIFGVSITAGGWLYAWQLRAGKAKPELFVGVLFLSVMLGAFFWIIGNVVSTVVRTKNEVSEALYEIEQIKNIFEEIKNRTEKSE